MKYEFQLTKRDLEAIRRLAVASTYVAVNQKTENTLVTIVESTVMIEQDEKLEFHRVANLLHVLCCARYATNPLNIEKKLQIPNGSLDEAYVKLAGQASDQDPGFVRKIMCWYDDRQQA